MVSTVECWSQRIESMTLRTDQWNLSSVNNGGTIIILKKLTESQKLWDNNQKNQSSYRQIPSIKGERKSIQTLNSWKPYFIWWKRNVHTQDTQWI